MEHVESSDELLDFVYQDHVLSDVQACPQQAILAPTHIQVDTYNKNILQHIDGEARIYLAADGLKEVDDVGMIQLDSILNYVA